MTIWPIESFGGGCGLGDPLGDRDECLLLLFWVIDRPAFGACVQVVAPLSFRVVVPLEAGLLVLEPP